MSDSGSECLKVVEIIRCIVVFTVFGEIHLCTKSHFVNDPDAMRMLASHELLYLLALKSREESSLLSTLNNNAIDNRKVLELARRNVAGIERFEICVCAVLRLGLEEPQE